MESMAFVGGLDRPALRADLRTQWAVVMSLDIVGEAATQLMDRHADVVAQHPLVPWRSMRLPHCPRF